MKVYKSYEELKADVAAKMAAFNVVTDLAHGLRDILAEEGVVLYEVYDYLNDCFLWSDNAAEFIENVRRNYADLKKHHDSLQEWEKKKTWNNPRIFKLLRKYVRHNFDPELWEAIPEFAADKKGENHEVHN